MPLTRADIENIVAFLDRCPLRGKEAETMVRIKYTLVDMHKKLPPPKDAAPTTEPPKNRGDRKKASK